MGEISLWPLAALYLGAVNLISFCAMGWDKGQARRRGRRVPERTLLLLDFLGGSLGGILGMLLFRHKTLHLKFRVLPVVFLGAQAGVLFWLCLAPPW